MSMKSSHQIHVEMIEQTLQPASCFQAAERKALVIRDALADDKKSCEALLPKIEQLLDSVAPANVSTSATASAAGTKELRSAA
jgi:hypothetical protein